MPGHLFGCVPLATFGAAPIAVDPDGFLTFTTPAVQFAGETYTSISMAENGFLVLGGTPGGMDTTANKRLADSSLPMAILAPLWTDLSGGELRAADVANGGSRWVVFEWTGMSAPGGFRFTFQAWLGQNTEDITFAYLQNPQLPSTGKLTIGAQERTGTVGRTLFFNGSGVLPLDDLRVLTDGQPVQQPPVPVPVPEPATLTLLASGSVASLAFRYRARKRE